MWEGGVGRWARGLHKPAGLVQFVDTCGVSCWSEGGGGGALGLSGPPGMPVGHEWQLYLPGFSKSKLYLPHLRSKEWSLGASSSSQQF